MSGDALAKAYASFDIFVHCGDLETFGQTIQEAMASGVPVIAPRRGGPVDLVEEGVTGMLYDPGKPRAMAEAVRALADDDALRTRMSAAARHAVQGRTWDKVCAYLMDYYQEAIRERHSRPAARLA